MVRKGYKLTEIGVIPEDWVDVPLGQLVVHTKGFAFKASDFRTNGVRVVRVSDTTYETIKQQDPIYIDESKATKFKKWSLKEYDLIISTVGSKPPMYDSMVGKATLVPLGEQGALLNQNAVILRSRIPGKYSQVLLHNTLKQPRYIDYIEKIFRGNANQASITLKELFTYRVAWPEKVEEQQAIAEALSDVDGLIDGLEKLIAKKQDIKTATMQQLLTGKTRLPDFGEGKRYKQTELGEIPEDWKAAKLGDLFQFKNGLNKAKEFFGYGTPIVNYMDVYQHPVLKVDSVEGRVNVNPIELRAYGVRKGDVFFTRTSETVAEIGIAAVMVEESDDTVFSGFVLRARSIDQSLDDNFKGYCFSSQYVRKQIIERASYTTRALTNGRSLSAVSILLPPIIEQQAIAEVLIHMDEELKSLQTRLNKTKAIKQGMMQELLMGKTRLV